MLPQASLTLFEAAARPMAKLALTGGGRCNLTNSFAGIRSLGQAYPRGEKWMKGLLKGFSQEDTCRWFEERGVRLVLQEDHCWFPASQDAMEIVRTLLKGLEGATIRTACRVSRIGKDLSVELPDGTRPRFDALVVTTGGTPSRFSLLDGLDIPLIAPVPSLFTFTTDAPIRALAGTVAEASVSIPGTSFKAEGPLLVTDWGLSGPAILKLSSYAARYLAEKGWQAPLAIHWLGASEQDTRSQLETLLAAHPRKCLTSVHPEGLTARLWEYLIARCGLRPDLRCDQVGSTTRNKLTDRLLHDTYTITGRNPFKEEFVTCGGVDTAAVDRATLACKTIPGLYFAGEVLDIDAITGGFNLQAAWSSAYRVAESITCRFSTVPR